MGVVLSGGSSSRMGRDKGLLRQNGLFWARRIERLLSPFVSRVVYSLNPEQIEEYRRQLGRIEIVGDSSPVAGPLKGILSVHRQNAEFDLLVVAVDLQNLQSVVLEHLLRQYDSHPEVDFLVFRNAGGHLEPLCGVYRSRGLDRLSPEKISASGDFRLHSLLASAGSLIVELPASLESSFKNYNTPEDRLSD